MKRILISLILVILCSHCIVALAQKRGAGKSPCEGTSGTQAETNACARYRHARAEAVMKRVYEQLMAELAGYEGTQQQKLSEAQTLWLQYRDANCESEASIYEGGSIRPAIYSTCLASMTQERTRRMRAFLADMRQ